MGLWIESHQELGQHPKVKRMAQLLGISRVTAVGHLHYLWWWAVDFAPNGSLERYNAEDIAEAAHWEGDAQAFWDALVAARFVDVGKRMRRLHDWREYSGGLLEKREKKRQADRKAKQEKSKKRAEEEAAKEAEKAEIAARQSRLQALISTM